MTNHDSRIRRMEGDVELLVAHVGGLRTVIADLSVDVEVFGRKVDSLAERLGTLLAELKAER